MEAWERIVETRSNPTEDKRKEKLGPQARGTAREGAKTISAALDYKIRIDWTLFTPS